MSAVTAEKADTKPRNPPAIALRRIGHIYEDVLSAAGASAWAPAGVGEEHLWPDLPVREATKAEKADYEGRAEDPAFDWLYAGHGQDICGPLAAACRECMGTGKALAGLDLPSSQMYVRCPNGCPLREDAERPVTWYEADAEGARASGAGFPGQPSSIWIQPPADDPPTMPHGTVPAFVPDEGLDDLARAVAAEGRVTDAHMETYRRARQEAEDEQVEAFQPDRWADDPHATAVMDRFIDLHEGQPAPPDDDEDFPHYDRGDGRGDDR